MSIFMFIFVCWTTEVGTGHGTGMGGDGMGGDGIMTMPSEFAVKLVWTGNGCGFHADGTESDCC